MGIGEIIRKYLGLPLYEFIHCFVCVRFVVSLCINVFVFLFLFLLIKLQQSSL